MTTTALIPHAAATELQALAQRYDKAGGIGLQVLNMLGGHAENMLERLPDPVKTGLEAATERALHIALTAAERSRERVPDQASWLNRAVTAGLGAAGGAGGLPTALTELPVTTTLLLRTIQGIADAHGFDPRQEEVRMECLQVFSAAGPLEKDDGANMAFLAARMTLNGHTVRSIITNVAPRLAAAFGQKIAAQSVPILGAAAGAATNYAYTSYYQEMAAVQFGLKRLARDHGLPEAQVLAEFRALMTKS